MDSNEISANWNESNLVISGLQSSDHPPSGKPWKASKIGSRRVIAFESAPDASIDKATGFAKCSADMLYDFFVGINQRRWSGMVSVDTGQGVKKLYFKSGELVFASSDLMDDRLGEVIYREAIISLDQLTQFAVQVDRKTKFGKVLLASGSFNTIDLWHALRSQVREIFRSVFLYESSFVEIQSGSSPVEISFETGTLALLDAAFSYGAQFRSFMNRIGPMVRIHRLDTERPDVAKQGTFIGDMLEICSGSPTMEEVIQRSKLVKSNTLLAIHRLVAIGHLKLEGMPDVTGVRLDGKFATLRSGIDAYQMLRGLTSAAFQSAAVKLPVSDLEAFALSLNHDGAMSIYLDSSGNLAPESIGDMLHQCSINNNRMDYFQNRIESLTRYLLLMAGDLLPFEKARDLRGEFREITT
jgi:hypothetical protein